MLTKKTLQILLCSNACFDTAIWCIRGVSTDSHSLSRSLTLSVLLSHSLCPPLSVSAGSEDGSEAPHSVC